MGLDTNCARFLFYCKKLGVDFARTATIGRQNVNLSSRELGAVFRSFGQDADLGQIDAILNGTGGYAEQLLTFLGAKDVHSFDISDFESATHLHDMNLEVPDRFKGQYSVVLDGGSLEHVFNFPTAIRNCMEMVSVGGHYLGITPANNCAGHGFYQFSPELFFSAFSRGNGFETIKVIAYEERPNARWYDVMSPVEAGTRVTVTNGFPIYLFVLARKIAATPVFAAMPQQSDLISAWGAPKTPRPVSTLETCLASVKRKVPASVKRAIRKVLWSFNSGLNPRYFRPMDPTIGTKAP
jgi:hypothetical protein